MGFHKKRYAAEEEGKCYRLQFINTIINENTDKNNLAIVSQISQVFTESINLFDLPLDEKMKYTRDFETTFHGYTKVGGER
jgi:isopenicillin N synthase-like dioxygenase